MAELNVANIEDKVADFILTSAQDSDCLHEPISESLGDDWSEELDEQACRLAYEIHSQALIIVVINGKVYVG